jgi:circadian clock protein KaiB
MTGGHDADRARPGAEIEPRHGECYELTLFVSGASALSARAIADATQLCEVHLGGRYHLTVVDVHVDPSAVAAGQVLAVPTLMRRWPLPVRRLAGDLSEDDKVLSALDLAGTGTNGTG